MALPATLPRLIAVTDRTVASAAETLRRYDTLARTAPAGNVMFQLRDHDLPAAERLRFGRELVALAREHGQLFQVNDRLDLAILLRADAVHLGENSVSTADARRIVGEQIFLTRACHDPNGVAEVDADGVLLSPIVAARKGREALGVEALTAARKALDEGARRRTTLDDGARRRTALYALGGIDAETTRACVSAGADGVAVIGALLRESGAELSSPGWWA